jgi:hypothetical protein
MKTVIYKRPTCVNHGCDSLVIAQSCTIYEAEQTNSWRPHCGRCQKAAWGGIDLAEGVTSFKTGRCTNDGVRSLIKGKPSAVFECCMDWDRMEEQFWNEDDQRWIISGVTEIDHRDGDPSNNSIKNLQELCKFCHTVKGQLAGDYDNSRRSYK